MRQTDFLVNVRPDGSMIFRTSLPAGDKYWDFKPAADGQLGRIINLYRDWQISGDLNFLQTLWPQAKKHWSMPGSAGTRMAMACSKANSTTPMTLNSTVQIAC